MCLAVGIITSLDRKRVRHIINAVTEKEINLISNSRPLGTVHKKGFIS